jgi:hypothetical protein
MECGSTTPMDIPSMKILQRFMESGRIYISFAYMKTMLEGVYFMTTPIFKCRNILYF